MKLGTPGTKLRRIQDALARGDDREALRVAASMPRLGEGAKVIRQASGAIDRPDFYREIGHDPDALIADALTALRARFGNP